MVFIKPWTIARYHLPWPFCGGGKSVVPSLAPTKSGASEAKFRCRCLRFKHLPAPNYKPIISRLCCGYNTIQPRDWGFTVEV